MRPVKRNKTFLNLGMLVILLMFVACKCSIDVWYACNDTEMLECIDEWHTQCPQHLAVEEFRECTDNYINEISGITPSLVPQDSGVNNVVAPTSLNCNLLYLTAPLAGLPNGTTTFYWDSLPNAVSYRINIYDHNDVLLRSFDSDGAATHLTADVSWSAIGGQYELRVELVAFGSNGGTCSSRVTIQREAPSGGTTNTSSNPSTVAPAPVMSPTPMCFPNPNDCVK